jgi:tetratricopeptide (TPR) repeat protein
MPKPGSRTHTPSDEMSRFTDREEQQATFQRHLHSISEPQVLVFYGVGGTGKTWLLKKLREQVPDGIPWAYLNFDVSDFGKRYVDDPVSAFQSIKQQLSVPTPRFDLALAMLHKKQGHLTESGSAVPWLDVGSELVSGMLPGAGPILKMLSKSALSRLEGSQLEKLLASVTGNNMVIELRKMPDQEIECKLLNYLSEDLTESLPPHLNKAVTCVIFLDTFEAVGAGFQNIEHKRSHEKWIQDLAAQCPFALVVIAGQNRLSWDEDPDWAEHLDQHLVGGLSKDDARQFLTRCDITSASLQDCILSTSKESTGGYHCFSLGLCSDIVVNERNAGREPEAESLQFNPQDWGKLARRFLKSLASDGERTWIDCLALTPRFDEAAARWAHSSGHSSDQDAAWKNLHGYSFVERVSGSEWFSIRAEMRAALRNQPSAQERVREDHQRWTDYWSSRSEAVADDAAGLAWYHSYFLDPSEAMEAWQKLAENARAAVPAQMREHSSLLQWLEPLGLFEGPPYTEIEAKVLRQWGDEQLEASLNRWASLQKVIACCEAALRIYTERESPRYWAGVQNSLGRAWSGLTTGDRTANLGQAIACFEAALRVRTEQKFPQNWAVLQNNLGGAWSGLPTGDRTANLKCAIDYYESALHIHTEHEFPQNWARVQNNLGNAWSHLPTGDLGANLKRAIACFEAALHVYTEQKFPQGWARVQSNLGDTWNSLTTGDKEANLAKAIACYEAAVRVFTEQEFPHEWAIVQKRLGNSQAYLATVGEDLCKGHRQPGGSEV